MKAQPIVVHLPDTRGVELSRYGKGNRKIGMEVYTYSRPPGLVETCPGSTLECETICYAKRVTGPVRSVWFENKRADVPPIPADCTLLRIHVSGDFDSPTYIANWIARLTERPDVTAWAYTRSWRVSSLLPALERLRALSNLQLFASMDPSTTDLPPAGWRRAWIWRDWDPANSAWPLEERLMLPPCKTCGDTGEYEGEHGPKACMFCLVGHQRQSYMKNMRVRGDGVPSLVCPEETDDKPDCASCGYCLKGKKYDVTFLEH